MTRQAKSVEFSEVESLKAIIETVDAMFDLGQGHNAGQVILPFSLWQEIKTSNGQR